METWNVALMILFDNFVLEIPLSVRALSQPVILCERFKIRKVSGRF